MTSQIDCLNNFQYKTGLVTQSCTHLQYASPQKRKNQNLNLCWHTIPIYIMYELPAHFELRYMMLVLCKLHAPSNPAPGFGETSIHWVGHNDLWGMAWKIKFLSIPSFMLNVGPPRTPSITNHRYFMCTFIAIFISHLRWPCHWFTFLQI